MGDDDIGIAGANFLQIPKFSHGEEAQIET